MAVHSKTFSESWHRIVDQKIALRANVKVSKRYFRGELWYVLQDPFNNQFFRLRPGALDFVLRLRQDRTVGEVWDECLTRDPDGVPGQDEVIQLLSQLHFASLLYYENPSDSANLFDRYKRRKQRELKSKLLSIMFFRLPLFDPDRLLKYCMPVTRWLINCWAALVWLGVVGYAVKLVVDHFDEASSQAQGVLAPGNLFFLYLGLVLIKTLHEFGHAVVCRHYGGEVHTMGIMFLIFTPIPYMDATSSWSFRNRWQRALVGGAGMIVEVFVAALATFVWANTGPGMIHSLAYNMMFVASVSTVLFNANPLLRFDGYYILSDLLDIPNLHTRSQQHLRHLAEHYLFAYQDSTSPAETRREAAWLVVFGVLSGIYRVVVFTGIILFIADQFLLAGMIMAVVCIISWGVVPLFKFTQYLATSPRLARTRLRATAISVGTLATVILFLAVFPFPNRFRAPGVVEAVQHIQVVNDTAGYVEAVLLPSGTVAESGAELLRLSDQELLLEIRAAAAQKQETMALERLAMFRSPADLEPIRKRMVAIEEKLANLRHRHQDLTVRARQQGVWVAPRSDEMVGTWIPRGTALGEVVNSDQFRFTAVISQDEASNLFAGQLQRAEVRLNGQSGRNLLVKSYEIIPFQHEKLPSAALGWRAGGDVPVAASDQSGLAAAEPFFLIYAELPDDPEVAFRQGRSGKIRFSMQPEPLLTQWTRSLRQLLQKRYQL
ncbi:MAG: hypothetical protein FIB02_05160 [Desulfuromonas sp.]|nr:hypothetical protein [Desulfuromonas sp.]